MPDIVAAQSDYGYTLTFVLRHLNKYLYDLTNTTVKLKAKINSPQYKVIERDCIVATDPKTGVCAYTVAQGDFTQAGQYSLELVLTDTGNSKVITVQGLTFIVNPLRT